MTTFVSPAAYAASQTLPAQGPPVKRTQLSEVIAALLGYRSYAALTESKTDASFEALVSPEHHALALTGSRLGELAPTLTTEFQDNPVRRFAWRPEDGRSDLYPAAAMSAQP